MTDTKEITLAQANALTSARYDFSKIEKNAVYLIISEVRKQFIEGNGQKDLFEDLIVTMNTSTLKTGIHNLRDVYKALKSLRQKSIWIEDDKRVLEIGYINYFEHIKRSEQLEIQVSKKLLPYLVELAERFTTYSLTVAIALNSQYSQRFYEYCSQFKSTGFLRISIEELRRQLMLETKYARYSLLKKYVIDVAHKELKTLYDKGECDLYFEYSEEKTSRSVHSLKIVIISRDEEKAAIAKMKPEDFMFHIKSWLRAWFRVDARPKNKAWVIEVIQSLEANPQNIKPLYERLAKMQQQGEAENYAAYSRHLIEEDFKI